MPMEPRQRSRSITWEDPFASAAAVVGMTGLAAVQAMLRGELPMPPIGVLMGFRGVEVAEGRAVLAVEPDEFHTNNAGVVHGGLASTILDSAMWLALHSTMPVATFCSTLQLSVNYVRPVPIGEGEVRAEGRAVYHGRRAASATGTLTDANGAVCAHATTMCLVRSLGG